MKEKLKKQARNIIFLTLKEGPIKSGFTMHFIIFMITKAHKEVHDALNFARSRYGPSSIKLERILYGMEQDGLIRSKRE